MANLCIIRLELSQCLKQMLLKSCSKFILQLITFGTQNYHPIIRGVRKMFILCNETCLKLFSVVKTRGLGCQNVTNKKLICISMIGYLLDIMFCGRICVLAFCGLLQITLFAILRIDDVVVVVVVLLMSRKL